MSRTILCGLKQQRLQRDCTDAQAGLSNGDCNVLYNKFQNRYTDVEVIDIGQAKQKYFGVKL